MRSFIVRDSAPDVTLRLQGTSGRLFAKKSLVEDSQESSRDSFYTRSAQNFMRKMYISIYTRKESFC